MSSAHYINESFYKQRQSEPDERYASTSPTFGSEHHHHMALQSNSYIPSQLQYPGGESSLLSRVRQDHSEAVMHASHSPMLGKQSLQLQISPTSQYYDDMTATTSNFPLSSSNEDVSPKLKSPSSKAAGKRERARLHTPRPSNSFILYRREKHMEIMGQYKGVKTLNNNVISKIVANMWRSETPEVKAHFAGLADAEKRAHMEKYPDYKYRPRKSASKKSPAKKLSISTGGKNEQYEEESPSPDVISPDQYSPSHHVFQVMNPKPMGGYMVPQYMPGNPYQMSDEHQRYEMMGEGFQMNHHHAFQSNDEFMGHDTMLGEASTYGSNWTMNPAPSVWDLELDQKPFERMPK